MITFQKTDAKKPSVNKICIHVIYLRNLLIKLGEKCNTFFAFTK